MLAQRRNHVAYPVAGPARHGSRCNLTKPIRLDVRPPVLAKVPRNKPSNEFVRLLSYLYGFVMQNRIPNLQQEVKVLIWRGAFVVWTDGQNRLCHKVFQSDGASRCFDFTKHSAQRSINP